MDKDWMEGLLVFGLEVLARPVSEERGTIWTYWV